MSDAEGRITRLDAERRKRQGGSVVAIVGERVVDELPTDLYIPPDALEVILETFEGPLDLLLYLIRRQNLDILEVRVAEITDQYMRYIELMSALRLTLAGEYLAMAATLAEIKSRLLPPPPRGRRRGGGRSPGGTHPAPAGIRTHPGRRRAARRPAAPGARRVSRPRGARPGSRPSTRHRPWT